MTRALALIALALTAAVIARVRRGRREAEDEMAAPFLDSRNSGTFYYNAATGVVVSAN